MGGGGGGGGVVNPHHHTSTLLPPTLRPALVIRGSVREGFLGARPGSHAYQRALLSAFTWALAGEVKGESEGGGEGLTRRRTLLAAREHRVAFASAIAWLLATHASKEHWRPPGNAMASHPQLATAWNAQGGFVLRSAWEGGGASGGSGGGGAPAPPGGGCNPRDASVTPRAVCAVLKAGVEGLKSTMSKAPPALAPAARFRGAALDKVWMGVEGLLLD